MFKKADSIKITLKVHFRILINKQDQLIIPINQLMLLALKYACISDTVMVCTFSFIMPIYNSAPTESKNCKALSHGVLYRAKIASIQVFRGRDIERFFTFTGSTQALMAPMGTTERQKCSSCLSTEMKMCLTSIFELKIQKKIMMGGVCLTLRLYH